MIIDDFIFMVLLYIALFLMMLLANRLSGLFNPAKILAYYWGVQIAFISLFRHFFIFRYTGLFLIILAVSCFCFGAMGGNKIAIFNDDKRSWIPCNEKFVMQVLSILIIFALCNPLLSLYKLGFNISALLELNSLLVVNNTASVIRYTQHVKVSTLNQIFLCFTYVAPLYGGYVYRISGKKVRILSLLSILPGVFVALTQAVKMAFITSSMLWISGFMVCSLLYKKEYFLSFNKILRLSVGAVFFLGILFLSMMFRIGRLDGRTAEVVSQKYVAYSMGHLPAFDNWYDSYNEISFPHTYGAKTFYGVSNYLGILKRKQGLFSEFTIINKEGGGTNVYSIFRLLVEDFGTVGCCVFMLLVGFFMQYVYKLLCAGVFPYLSVVLLSMIYFTIFWSFATSIFVYTSYIVMFVLFYFLVRITSRYE